MKADHADGRTVVQWLRVTDRCVGLARVTEDLVDDVRERAGCVDHHARRWDVFLRPVEPDDEVALGRLGAPLVQWSLIQTFMQRVDVDVEDEDLIEQIEELMKVAGPTAEEGGALPSVGCSFSHKIDVPDVVFMVGRVGRLTGLGVALVCEFSVAVDCLVATPLQLAAHRGLAGCGNTFDEIVANTHAKSMSSKTGGRTTSGSAAVG